MDQGFRHIVVSLRPALLIGFCLALSASIWATLPDAHLTQGMYFLAAQTALPYFTAAALILVLLGGLALAESLVITRTGPSTRHRQPVIGSPAGAAALLVIVFGRYLLHNLPLPELIPHQCLVGTGAIVVIAAILWLGLHVTFRGTRFRMLSSGPARALVALALVPFCLLQLYARGWLPMPSSRGPNVLLVGVDTLRADHMGCYGYHRDTTPNIDAWASGAVIFDQCTVSTPRTTQSMASILTARYPKDIGVRYLSDRLPREQLSLAEILKNQGYTTIAVIATGVPHGKLEDGFDLVLDTESEWTASETLGKALEQLALVKGNYFLFVFFRDPHMPYRPSEATFTDPSYQGRFIHEVGFVPDKQNCVFRNQFTPEERAQAVALYDSEIRDIDRSFGRLLEEVEKKGGETLTAFFSDHGESLGEHDYYYDHGDLLYQPSLRVPLIIEGIPFPDKHITRQVRSIDLVPTLLAGLGLDPRQYPFQGVDLQRHEVPLPAFSESGHAMIRTAYTTGRRQIHGLRGRLRSLTMDHHKLICIPTHQGYEFEYYDLLNDPEEVIGLVQNGARYQEMKERLLSWVEEDRRNWTGAVKVYDEQTRQRLESLGYLDQR